MKIISVVEDKPRAVQQMNMAKHPPGPAMAGSDCAGMDRIALQQWLKAHGRRMPLVILMQRGRPAVVSDVKEAGASEGLASQASLRKLEEQIEYVCEFWTGWSSRAQ